MLDHNGDPIIEGEWYVVQWTGAPYADDKLAVSAGQAEDLSIDAVTLRPYANPGFLAMGLRLGLDQIVAVYRTTREVTERGTFNPATDALGPIPRCDICLAPIATHPATNMHGEPLATVRVGGQMSTARITFIYCDHPECESGEPYDSAPMPGDTAAIQRAEAKQEGWTSRGGKDYCPEHSG